VVPLSLECDLLFFSAVLIIICAVTGGTQAEKDRGWVANIMIFMCCMQKHGIDRSCLSGDAFCTLLDVANLALPARLLLTLPGERFPILGILLSPFRFHH
jgi:hypothetical protein